jgi:polysaccharide export outer membrane protein
MGGGISSGNTASPAAGVYGYLINDKGQVEFPVLGSVNLDGLTRIQAVALLREKIKVYVNNPIVDLKIMNHKISVLGEVRSPGVYPITNEQMTLTEAIALSGDLLISGMRKNILVIREVNGVKTETRVDITSPRLFESPVYYLQHNDIVYVQPTKARIASAGQGLQYTSLAIGSLSFIINLFNILTR